MHPDPAGSGKVWLTGKWEGVGGGKVGARVGGWGGGKRARGGGEAEVERPCLPLAVEAEDAGRDDEAEDTSGMTATVTATTRRGALLSLPFVPPPPCRPTDFGPGRA